MISQPAVPRQPWRGTLEIGDLWAVWSGQPGDTVFHRHIAAQAVLSTEGIQVEDADGQIRHGEVVLIDPLVPHRLKASSPCKMIFVESLAALADISESTLAPIRHSKLSLILDQPDDEFWRRWLMSPHPSVGTARLERQAVSARIDNLAAKGIVRLNDVAGQFGLSGSRFRHLFVETFGLPFRRYVLWRRLRLAVLAMSASADAARAAHEAGFADQAHFARTLKIMFGVNATQFLARPRRSG